MRRRFYSKISLIVIAAFSGVEQIHATDTTVTNLTITESMAVGVIHINEGINNYQVPGFRVRVTQDSTNEIYTNTIHYPAYTVTESTVHDMYGEISQGYYQDTYAWDKIREYWVDDVYADYGYYDGEGTWIPNLQVVTPGHWESEFGYVVNGQEWVHQGYEWGVTGSYTTYEDIYHPATTTTEEVEYESFDRPKIKLSATRSDANWVWQVPHANGNQDNMRDIMVLFDGGLKIPSVSPDVGMSLLADNLTYSRSTTGTDFTLANVTQSTPEKFKVSAEQSFNDSSKMKDVASLEAQKISFTYSYTNQQNQTVTKQTQVGAEASYFSGLVTMKNNVNVEGVVRVLPAGNMSMGDFDDGPTPVPQIP